MAPFDLPVASPFGDEIWREISRSHLLLPVVTKSSVDRPWVNQEIGYAVAAKVPVLPLGVAKGFAGQIHGIEIDEEFQSLGTLLTPACLDRAVARIKTLNSGVFQHAESHLERTRLIVELVSLVHSVAGHVKIYQYGAFSSFSLPDKPPNHPIWDVIDGNVPKRSDDLRKEQWRERQELEKHARAAGCKLVLDPLIVFKTRGYQATAARLQILVDFLESMPRDKIEVAFADTRVHRNLLLLGDWCFAESATPVSGKGYLQTLVTWHACTVLDRLHWFDDEFRRLAAQSNAPPKEPPNVRIDTAIAALKARIDELLKFPARAELTASEEKKPVEASIRKLHIAEDRYLQLLLSQFTIVRHRESTRRAFELFVSFDDETPAIWDQDGKRHLLKMLSPELRQKYQRELNAFFFSHPGVASDKDAYEFNSVQSKSDADFSFVFRYASGGTLPIIRMEERGRMKEYYCLPYRDVHPIGWNIANGGSDTREELLNPQQIIERELREELIIADFANDIRYVFPADFGKPLEHPAHTVARRLWTRRFPQKNLTHLRETKIEIDWVPGPDSLCVRDGNGTLIRQSGFFLNINATDFGIEFDRVAKISLPNNVILFDGEIDAGYLVNSPVGLFEVQGFNSLLRASIEKSENESCATQFLPNFFFFDGTRYNSSDLDDVIRLSYLPTLHAFRNDEEIATFKASIDTRSHFGLCPVTRTIITRFLDFSASSAGNKVQE